MSDPIYPRYERSEPQKTMDSVVLARVKQGIALLQEQYGDEWVEKINLRSLCLSSGSSCVLGQLYGDYQTGKERLGLDTDEAILHGFLAGSGPHRREGSASFSQLDEEWRSESSTSTATSCIWTSFKPEHEGDRLVRSPFCAHIGMKSSALRSGLKKSTSRSGPTALNRGCSSAGIIA